MRDGFPALAMHWFGVMLTFGSLGVLLLVYGPKAGVAGALVYIGGMFLAEGRKRILKVRDEVEN